MNTQVADFIVDQIDNAIELFDDQARMLAEQTEGGRDAKVVALARLVDRFNESLAFAKQFCSRDRRAFVCNIEPIELECVLAYVSDYVELG